MDPFAFVTGRNLGCFIATRIDVTQTMLIPASSAESKDQFVTAGIS